MRYSISLSYDGSDFRGWQVQPRDPSVQQTVEDALSRLLGQSTSLVGAGRTDTGVNAIGYVAHFDCEKAVDCEQLRYKLNAILPHSIAVHSVAPAPAGFHARFDARQREYTYFLHTMKDPFVGKYSYHCSFPLDFAQMNRAAALLCGTHDFSCFEKVGADNKTSVCTVYSARWEPYTPSVCCQNDSDVQVYWRFTICADRFLRNMVRAVVGTLVEVGRARRSVADFDSLILPIEEDACEKGKTEGKANRCLAGESAPGHALFLTKVSY